MDEEQVTTERTENHNHGTLLVGATRGIVEDRGECCAERDEPQPLRKANQIRDFNVKQLNYGYIVKIGCHSFALESHEKLIEKLDEYLKDPDATEKKWYKGDLL